MAHTGNPKIADARKDGLLAFLAVLGAVAALHYAASVIITLLSSLLVAFALEPAVRFLRKRAGLPRPFASLVVVFVTVGLLYVLLYFAYAGSQALLSDLPLLAERVRTAPVVQAITERITEANRVLEDMGRRLSPAAPVLPGGRGVPMVVVKDALSWKDALFEGLGSVGSVLFSLSFIPFLVYFILAEKDSLTERTVRLFPGKEHEARHILGEIETMMQRFLVGNAIVAAILSAFTILVFWSVGLPYWFVLGIASGVGSTVPYLGVVLALLPGVVVGVVTFDSAAPLAIAAVAVVLLHLVAANYLVPKLVGGRTHVNATVSTVALMSFGWLWGGMGLLLAIPILAVTRTILENVEPLRRFGQWLGDRPIPRERGEDGKGSDGRRRE
jgi:predicted PurR-regulated permease PerM